MNGLSIQYQFQHEGGFPHIKKRVSNTGWVSCNSAFRWLYLSFSPLLFASLLFTAICKASPDNHFPFSHSFTHFLQLLFFSQLFLRFPKTTILPFLYSFFLGMVLITASCTMLQTFIHSSSGTLSIRFNPLNLFVTSTVES